MNDEVYFWLVDINIKVDTINLGVHIQVCLRHSKQKVCVSLQYVQKDMDDEVAFLHADKHKRFLLQVDIIILDGYSQPCAKALK